MAAGKLFNLIALTALALFATSFAPTPVNALASPALHARHHAIQESFNRKKRDSVASRANTKRCRPRPTSSVASASPTTAPAASQAPTSAPSPTKASETSSPASQPTHSSGGNSGNGSGGNLFSGGKVGLAWPNAGDPSLKNFITGNVGGLYTWSPFCPDNSPVPCYRMLWGDNQVQQFEQQVKGPATENDNVILGFNEPNEPGQSNMSPQHACELWHQHIQPKKQLGYTLVAPATSSNPNGLTWVQDFMKCCSDCTIDAVAVHWYDIHADDFIKYINLWHDTFGKPVVVTEYAVQNFNNGAQASKDEIFAFHQKVGPYMLSQPWIAKFFPFGVMHDMQGVNNLNQLMDANGNPTDLGWMIINSAY